MNILKTAAVVAVGLVALAGCKLNVDAVDTAADESAIRDGSRAWATAYNAGDADGVASLYTEDAVLMPPGTPAKYGRAAIREFIVVDSAAAKAAGLTLTIEHGDTVVMSGDLAWHAGPYSVHDASGALVDSGSYVEALQKVEGKWLTVRDIYNSDKAPAPAAEPGDEVTEQSGSEPVRP
ncbi:MAG: ketosteroid isomerase-like protein [Steroidobacteraceae bacterium]|nr:ketosteroid isomerase-like protein [Steroidobacteraceae bacterium]